MLSLSRHLKTEADVAYPVKKDAENALNTPLTSRVNLFPSTSALTKKDITVGHRVPRVLLSSPMIDELGTHKCAWQMVAFR